MSQKDIERLQQKIAKDPDSKLFVPLAEEYKKAGMVDEAINTLIQGLEKQPHYLSARVSLGKIYIGKGLLREAKDQFQKVIAFIPDNLYAHKKLAEIYQELGETDNAINELKVVLNLNPTDEWGISTLSAIETESGPASAEPAGYEIPELPAVPSGISGEVPEDLEASPDTVGGEEVGDDEIAGEELRLPEERAEEHPPLYHVFLDAENYIKQGKYSEAMETYKTVLAEDPDNIQALQRMAELKALFKILGKDQEEHIMQLERFLEGLKKRRDEFFGSARETGGNSG